MKTVLFALLTLVMVFHPGAAKSTTPKLANNSQEILGVVGAYLPQVALSKQNTWEVIKVVTDQFSGTATPSGVSTISGSYTVVHQLGAALASPSGRYAWSEPSISIGAASLFGQPNASQSRWLESGLFASQFNGRLSQSATHFLLCVVHERSSGQDKFTDVHLIPDGWEKYILPAVLYLRSHPKLVGSNSTDHWNQLRSLLANSNPYLMVTGLELLAANKELMPADMNLVFASSDAKIIACSLVIAHLYSWSDLSDNAQWLKAKVAAIRSLNQLEGIAFGVFIVVPYSMAMQTSPITDLPNLPKPIERQGAGSAKQNYVDADLLPLVRQKLTELDPNGTTADEQWRNIDQICQQDAMMQKYLPKPQPAPGAGQKP